MTYAGKLHPAGWFASLVTKPVIITEPGRYLTRRGEVVEIHTASQKNQFACHGRYPCGVPDHWHRSGRLYFGIESGNDIVSKAP